MDKIQRDISKEALEMAKSYPIVTLTGPRQSGKTTFATMVFPEKDYVSMESPDDRMLASQDPRRFFDRFPKGAIIDEIQRTPELLSYLQEIVDKRDEKGLFILTGSHQLSLHASIAQSLSGRTAMLKLMPFSLNELAPITSSFSVDEFLFHGMYPRIYKDHIDSTKFYRDYVATYLERDVRQMVNIKDLSLFQNFLKLCAGRIGQLLNTSSLANDLGISHSTVLSWISILESSFIVYRLTPYFGNFGKRIIKSPKLYFADTGLARYLLDILTIEQIARDPLRGALFENFVITECLKHQLNKGIEPSFYFYRDSNQNEVDLLYKKGSGLTCIEIKASQTYNSEFLKGLKKVKNMLHDKFDGGFVIYAGYAEQPIDHFGLLNFKNIHEIFK